MDHLDAVVERIVRDQAKLSTQRALLVGLSGIDGCGKGYVTRQLASRLTQQSLAVANINIDGWLNLPHQRFNASEPGRHFYDNAIRFEELFENLLLPLRNQRSIELTADFAYETAQTFRRYTYSFRDIDVVLAEGIFLFKHPHRKIFDLKIWIDCSLDAALRRALERSQEGLPPAETITAYNTIYFPAQEIHQSEDRPRDFADLIIDNDLEEPASTRV